MSTNPHALHALAELRGARRSYLRMGSFLYCDSRRAQARAAWTIHQPRTSIPAWWPHSCSETVLNLFERLHHAGMDDLFERLQAKGAF